MSAVGWFTRKKPEASIPAPADWRAQAAGQAPAPAAGKPPPKIRKSVIDLICASAQSQHPNEFGAMLRAEKGIVSELVLLPGTVSGRSHAIFQFHMLPIDFSVRGTVHSHPGGDPRPSDADLELFRKHGTLHVIIAEPYTPRTWRAYDGRGDPVRVEVVGD